MTTKEFEEALKATDDTYVIDEIIKNDGGVSRVRGYVPMGNGFRKVVWHPSGECFSPKGKRLPVFDLIFKKITEI